MVSPQDIKIAVLEREVFVLREQLDKHAEDDREMFKNIWNELKNGLDRVQGDLKEIFAYINNSKGKESVRMLFASALGGLIVAIVPWILSHF